MHIIIKPFLKLESYKMSLKILLCLLLVIQNAKSAETNCDKIKPSSAADCKLSANDKSGFLPKVLCCYEEDYLNSGFKCQSYSEGFSALKTDECYNETNMPDTCEFINPNSASDCVLSEGDKAKFDYCCYMVEDGVKSCSAETKDSYEIHKGYFAATANKQDVFDCKNEIGFIFPRIIYFLLILLNLWTIIKIK